jgi:hypothetical protein
MTGDRDLLPGAAAGVAGLTVFLVLHHLWIVPIWFVLPVGLPIAVAGGIAVDRACRILARERSRQPGTIVAVAFLASACLMPALLLAELRPPMFDISAPGGAELLVTPERAVALFVAELLVTATATGAIVGWWFGRTRRAAAAMALAGLALALGPGHNVPFGGATPAVGLQVAIMAAVLGASALVLVAARTVRLKGHPRAGPAV